MTGLVGSLVLWLLAAVVAVVVVVYLLNWLYHRSTKEIAFVRTGFGGEKVVINGGALVLPILHEVTPVSLNVTRIPISRVREHAVVTGDRVRVDIEAEFFVRVPPQKPAVSAAAAALGRRSMEPAQLAELLSGKFVGALRSVASERGLDEMHEQRGAFVAAVEERAGLALAPSGLELESVAVTDLDQTGLEFFNPSNRFDAEGLTLLSETIEERRKLRNDIEQSSMIAIRLRNLDAEKQTLTLEQEAEEARLNQQRELDARRAEQRAAVARIEAANESDAEQARIERQRTVEAAEIAAREELDRLKVRAEQGVEEARIAQRRELRRLDIQRELAVELAEADRQVDLLRKAAEEAEAKAATEAARAKAVEAEERVATVRDTEAAERDAAVARIAASRDAEAAKVAAEADRAVAAVAAEALRQRNEAENLLSEDARVGRLREMLLERLEGIIRECGRPLKKVEGIRVLHVDGAGGRAGGAGGSPTDDVIESVLRYRVQAPLIDELMKEVGVENANLARAGDLFRPARDAASLAREVERKGAGDG